LKASTSVVLIRLCASIPEKQAPSLPVMFAVMLTGLSTVDSIK